MVGLGGYSRVIRVGSLGVCLFVGIVLNDQLEFCISVISRILTFTLPTPCSCYSLLVNTHLILLFVYLS